MTVMQDPMAMLEALLQEAPEAADARAAAWLGSHGGGRSWVLHGAGHLGRRVLAHMRAQGLQVKALTDMDARRWGQEVEGLVIQDPSQVLPALGEEDAVLVSIFNTHVGFRTVARELSRWTHRPVLPVEGYFWQHPEAFLPAYAMDLPSTFLRGAQGLREAAAMLADAESLRHFVGQIRWRLLLDAEALPHPAPADQYFDPALVPARWEGAFVDAGAYDGDTLRVLRQRQGGTLPPVVAFEPDPDSFQRLQAWVQGLPPVERDRVDLHAIAVGAEPGEVRFETDLGTGSRVGEAGTLVPVRPLSDLLTGRRLGFLKMDLEGAEREALEGAAPLVLRDAPVGAICIYHRPDDLWVLPARIRALFRTHTFHVRTHGEDGFDVVWYAIPRRDVTR